MCGITMNSENEEKKSPDETVLPKVETTRTVQPQVSPSISPVPSETLDPVESERPQPQPQNQLPPQPQLCPQTPLEQKPQPQAPLEPQTKVKAKISRCLKRKRISAEVQALTRDEYRSKRAHPSLEADTDSNTNKNTNIPNSVQLYASDFDNITVAKENIREGKRPKRRIKAVQRYKDTRLTHAQQLELSRKKGKCGTGFMCPQCNTHLSYDMKECWQCGANCGYFPGIGVLLLKDRNDVTKIDEGDYLMPDILSASESKNKSSSIISKRITRGAKKMEQEHENESSKQKSYEIFTKRKTLAVQRKSIARKAKSYVNEGVAKLTASSVCSEVSGVDTFYLSKEKAKEILSNSATKECEACMQVFLPTYLQRHRRRSHGLNPDSYGCPYCKSKKVFKSMAERNDHVAKHHPGSAFHLPKEVMDKNRVVVYACPKCDTAMAYSDLRDHMKNVHGMDFKAAQHMITCTCPFCLEGSTPRRTTFLTVDALQAHVKLCHEGCTISGKKIKLGGLPITKPCESVKKTDAFVTKLEPNESTTAAPTPEGDGLVVDCYWFALQPDILIKEAKLMGLSFHKSQSVDSIIDAVDHTIKQMKEHEVVVSKHYNQIEEKRYILENKLYIRGIRERRNKAEGEALEKAMYKYQCEDRQRVLDYHNRGKKKSFEEIELDEFICRPFHWQGTSHSANTRRSKCPIGPECELCNGWYARYILTDEEIIEGGGSVKETIKFLTENGEKIKIPSKGFRSITDADLPDDVDDDENIKGELISQCRRPRRNDKAELWKLMKLKNSLDFIKKFNSGTITSTKKQK